MKQKLLIVIVMLSSFSCRRNIDRPVTTPAPVAECRLSSCYDGFVTFDDKGRLTLKDEVLEYDPLGRIFFQKGDGFKSLVTYGQGMNFSVKRFFDNEYDESELQRTEYFEFDSYGNLVKTKIVFADPNSSSLEYTRYEYENGNLVRSYNKYNNEEETLSSEYSHHLEEQDIINTNTNFKVYLLINDYSYPISKRYVGRQKVYYPDSTEEIVYQYDFNDFGYVTKISDIGDRGVSSFFSAKYDCD